MLLPNAGMKIADWLLRGFIQCVIVYFKRLTNRVFTIHLINILFKALYILQKVQMQYTLERILWDFSSDVFLIFFMNIEISIELYNGENLYRILQLSWPRYDRRVTSIEWNGRCQYRIHLINILFKALYILQKVQMQYTLERILWDFSSDVFLIFFMNIEISIELYNGENLYRILQLSWPRYDRRVTSIEWNGRCQYRIDIYPCIISSSWGQKSTCIRQDLNIKMRNGTRCSR